MILSATHDNASPNTPAYVFEIQQLLMRENVPVGTEGAMLAVAAGLTKETDLRRNLRRTVQEIIQREGGRINAIELLFLILMASASPVDPLSGEGMERAMYETLGFVLEIRHPSELSRAENRSPGLTCQKERLPAWLEPLPLAGWREKISVRGRSRVMLVTALCGLLAACLIVGLSVHRRRASDNAGAQTSALPNSEAGNSTKTLARDINAAQSTQWLPAHNAQFPLKASVKKSEKSGTKRKRPLHVAAPIAVATRTIPATEPRLHAAAASPSVAMPSVSNSITRPNAGLANSMRPRTAATANVSTGLVVPARPKPDAQPRSLVQSGSAGIMAANLIWSPTPAYPAAASAAQVEGEVTVNALVGKDGNVLSARVVSGPPLLRDAALKAVEKWQYHPYLVSGRPGVIATTAIINFELVHD